MNLYKLKVFLDRRKSFEKSDDFFFLYSSLLSPEKILSKLSVDLTFQNLEFFFLKNFSKNFYLYKGSFFFFYKVNTEEFGKFSQILKKLNSIFLVNFIGYFYKGFFYDNLYIQFQTILTHKNFLTFQLQSPSKNLVKSLNYQSLILVKLLKNFIEKNGKN